MVLDHYIRSVHSQPSIRMYLHIGKQWMVTSSFSVTVSCLCLYHFSGTSILSFNADTNLLMDICSCKSGIKILHSGVVTFTLGSKQQQVPKSPDGVYT